MTFEKITIWIALLIFRTTDLTKPNLPMVTLGAGELTVTVKIHCSTNKKQQIFREQTDLFITISLNENKKWLLHDM